MECGQKTSDGYDIFYKHPTDDTNIKNGLFGLEVDEDARVVTAKHPSMPMASGMEDVIEALAAEDPHGSTATVNLQKTTTAIQANRSRQVVYTKFNFPEAVATTPCHDYSVLHTGSAPLVSAPFYYQYETTADSKPQKMKKKKQQPQATKTVTMSVEGVAIRYKVYIIGSLEAIVDSDDEDNEVDNEMLEKLRRLKLRKDQKYKGQKCNTDEGAEESHMVY